MQLSEKNNMRVVLKRINTICIYIKYLVKIGRKENNKYGNDMNRNKRRTTAST
jgi:hypothetical protein